MIIPSLYEAHFQSAIFLDGILPAAMLDLQSTQSSGPNNSPSCDYSAVGNKHTFKGF